MLAVVTLAIVFSLGGAVLLFLAYRASRRARKEIDNRVDQVARTREQVGPGLGVHIKAHSKKFDARLRNFFAFGSSRTWGMQAGTLKLLAAAIILSGVTWSLTALLLGFSAWITIPLAVAAFFLAPRIVLMREQRRAKRQFVALLPATIDTAIRMLRAGLPITASMRFIGTSAQPPINTVFAEIADQAEMGVPVEEALDAGSRKVGLPDFRFFAVTVVLQRATGGNLASTLEIISDIMRKRHALRQKTKAASAEIRISAYVLGALPFLCVGGMLIIRPEYFAPLIYDPRGQAILAMAGGSLLLAFVTMQQMIRRVSSG